MSETFQEQLERIESMSRDNGDTWDLSENDQYALAAVARRLRAIERVIASWQPPTPALHTIHEHTREECAEELSAVLDGTHSAMNWAGKL